LILPFLSLFKLLSRGRKEQPSLSLSRFTCLLVLCVLQCAESLHIQKGREITKRRATTASLSCIIEEEGGGEEEEEEEEEES
jgi:hypothetical protein